MNLSDARGLLIENFKRNPICIESDKLSRALIMDSIPELCAEKNIMVSLYHAGFIDELRQLDDPAILKNKYKIILTKEFGYSENISLWCIDTWILIIANIFDKEVFAEKGLNKSFEAKDALVVAKNEYERLLEEIANLKALIASLTTERDNLMFHECREIAAEYSSKIGELELQVLNAKLNVLRLKRMIEILQSQINRQERKSEKKVKEQVDQEYREFEEDLKHKAEEANSSYQYRQKEEQQEEEWEQEKETSEDSESNVSEKQKKYRSRTDEMKALYRKIVKALHPDMNPDETDAEKEMFNEAVDAYNNGNLNKLREIAALIDEGKICGTPYSVSADDIEKLKEIISGLKLRVEELEEEIETIKTSFPYTMKAFLNDELAVNERQKELTDMLIEYEKQVEDLEKRFADMLGK